MQRKGTRIIFLPGLKNGIEDMVKRFTVCMRNRNIPQKESQIPHVTESLPWIKLGVNLFDLNGPNLLIVDYYSKYTEIRLMKSRASGDIIFALKTVFARYGIPTTLVSDSGPQFYSSEIRKFVKEWNIDHQTSSPHYAQSNGMVERTLQTIKKLLKKAIESNSCAQIALLEYRATPLFDSGYSPTQLLFNRQLRTRIPITKEQMKPSMPVDVERKRKTYSANCKAYFDRNLKEMKHF